MNDNNNGGCRNCCGETEMKSRGGKWREVTVKEPRPKQEWASERKTA
jgi:hypothetical protein